MKEIDSLINDLIFDIGEVLYLKTDEDQMPRILVHIIINENGCTYGLSCGTNLTYHYKCEISRERII